jgi:hypothetical protein
MALFSGQGMIDTFFVNQKKIIINKNIKTKKHISESEEDCEGEEILLENKILELKNKLNTLQHEHDELQLKHEKIIKIQ